MTMKKNKKYENKKWQLGTRRGSFLFGFLFTPSFFLGDGFVLSDTQTQHTHRVGKKNPQQQNHSIIPHNENNKKPTNTTNNR